MKALGAFWACLALVIAYSTEEISNLVVILTVGSFYFLLISEIQDLKEK